MSHLDIKALCEQILSQAPDAIMYADQEGIIQLWNHGAERIFGFSTKEALGKSLDLIIPEKLRERHWEGYHKTMATGITRYGTDLLAVPALHQDGSKNFNGVLYRDAVG